MPRPTHTYWRLQYVKQKANEGYDKGAQGCHEQHPNSPGGVALTDMSDASQHKLSTAKIISMC